MLIDPKIGNPFLRQPYEPGRKLRPFETNVARYAVLPDRVPYAGCLPEETAQADFSIRMDQNRIRQQHPKMTNFESPAVTSLRPPKPSRASRARVNRDRFFSTQVAQALHLTEALFKTQRNWRGGVNLSAGKGRKSGKQNESFQVNVLCQSQWPRQRTENVKDVNAVDKDDDYGLPHLMRDSGHAGHGRCQTTPTHPLPRRLNSEALSSASSHQIARALIDPPTFITSEQRRMFPTLSHMDTSQLLTDFTLDPDVNKLAPTKRMAAFSQNYYGRDGPGRNVFTYDLPTRREKYHWMTPLAKGTRSYKTKSSLTAECGFVLPAAEVKIDEKKRRLHVAHMLQDHLSVSTCVPLPTSKTIPLFSDSPRSTSIRNVKLSRVLRHSPGEHTKTISSGLTPMVAENAVNAETTVSNKKGALWAFENVADPLGRFGSAAQGVGRVNSCWSDLNRTGSLRSNCTPFVQI